MLISRLPDSPVYLNELDAKLQEQFVLMHKKCHAELWRAFPEKEVIDVLYSIDIREILATPETTDAKGRPIPFWAVGRSSRLFLGHWDNWFQMLGGALSQDGWQKRDPETIIPVRISRKDALGLADIWRARLHKYASGRDGESIRLTNAIIALLSQGAVEIKPGKMSRKKGLMKENVSALIGDDLGYLNARELANETLSQDRTAPAWAVCGKDQVMIGHWEVWALLIKGPMEDGNWRPSDRRTKIKLIHESPYVLLPHCIGQNDARTLARIWKNRLKKCAEPDAASRLINNLCALFMKGAVRVEARPEPDHEALPLNHPVGPPHLRLAKWSGEEGAPKHRKPF